MGVDGSSLGVRGFVEGGKLFPLSYETTRRVSCHWPDGGVSGEW